MQAMAAAIQYGWHAAEPVLEVESGAEVSLELRDASDGQVSPTDVETYRGGRFDGARGNPITGPIRVVGAEPGDVLQVDVLDVKPGAWGWTGMAPGYGLLPGDFSRRDLLIWQIHDGIAETLGFRLPIHPFCGVLGVCPDGSGPHPVAPPRWVGGNLDVRQLVAGATLYLPVALAGAWFGAGDAHARQGDGEVCGSAIEMPASARLRLTVRRDLRLTTPAFDAPPDPHGRSRLYAVSGVDTDLFRAGQTALRRLIEWIVARYQVTPEQAYMLSSVLVDMRISEVANPTWVVTACWPLDEVERGAA